MRETTTTKRGRETEAGAKKEQIGQDNRKKKRGTRDTEKSVKVKV